ncbi:MAG: glycosyltransferase [Planctomycetota bacterium]
MRSVAFFCMPEPGHFQRMLPLVAGIAARGIKAHVFTHRDFRERAERAGGLFIDLFAKYPPTDVASLPVPCRHVTFAGHYADDLRRDLEGLGVSLVVHDTFAVVGAVVARLLGIPRVNVCAGHNVQPARFLDALATDPRVKVAPECHRAVETLRTRHGIADASPFSYVTALSPHLNVCCEPPQFLDEEDRHAFEPLAFFGSLQGGPEAPAAPDPFGDARLKVYVSFGTVVWRYYAAEAMRALKAVADAFAARPDARVLISLGGADVDGAPLARPNVAVARYVDQRSVLRSADAYVTHHGLNSTHEAIFREVPMISCPFFWDQPGLAAKCERFGVAVPLAAAPRAPVTQEDVGTAIGRLLDTGEPMRRSLSEAREWEIAVMANRSSVLQRIAEL